MTVNFSMNPTSRITNIKSKLVKSIKSDKQQAINANYSRQCKNIDNNGTKAIINSLKNVANNVFKAVKKHPVVAGLAAAVTIPTVIATTKKVVENLKLKKMVKKTKHEVKNDSHFLKKVYKGIKSGKIKTIKPKEAD